jgi:RimJ/RimL family protein N-acetyltransferase
MTTELILEVEPVFEFVTGFFPLCRSAGQQGIGLKRDGEIIAGVLYDDYNGSNVWMHVAAKPNSNWLNRMYLKACFLYPFKQLNCKRVSGWVEVSNTDARRFDEHLGFQQEAVLSGAARDGGDVIIYRMFKEECRFIPQENAKVRIDV